jgi:ankyrin repeat protein
VHNLLAALDNHVNINSRDTEGRTALMLAIVHGQSDAVKALLSHGADPNIPDGQNQTPLHAANAGGQWLIVVFLKRAGAK